MNALQKKLETFGEEELARIYHNCFDTDAGQLVLQDLKNRCFMHQPPVPDGGHDYAPIDSNRTHFNNGKQAVVMSIETMLNLEPEKKEGE